MALLKDWQPRPQSRSPTLGFDQPLVLLMISACVGGFMMFVYAGLLILLNRRVLPEQIRIKAGRIVALGWAIVLFGVLAALTIATEVLQLFGG